MKFVLCSTQTYQELYQAEAHKWVRVEDHKDLIGFRNVHVTIHDCWMYEINDDRVDYLEKQLTALADFGYISITYQSEDGWSENYEREEAAPTEKQVALPLGNPSAVVAYEVEDSGCEGGACKI
tara:strand:+ start:521 stop:892 length:372 start_codon:yes stop_codon:yes gene_type:complete